MTKKLYILKKRKRDKTFDRQIGNSPPLRHVIKGNIPRVQKKLFFYITKEKKKETFASYPIDSPDSNCYM